MKISKKILLILSAFVLMMFLVSCLPKETDENLAGEAFRSSFRRRSPSCSAGYSCVNPSTSQYRYSNCNVAQPVKCQYGCVNGYCKPAPVVNFCIDSDNGQNYNVKGEVKFNSTSNPRLTTYTDTCFTSQNRDSSVGYGVKEFYCSNNLPRTYIYACSNGCENGVCKAAQPTLSGACMLTGNTFSSSTLTPTTANIGIKYAKQQITGVNTIDGLRNSCTLAVYQNLESQYCAYGNNKNEKFQRGVLTFKQDGKVESSGGASAAAGSSNVFTCPGYVAPSVCTDSDGIDYYSVGTVKISGNSTVFTDYCIGLHLIEYSCSAQGSLVTTNYGCHNGCLNSQCLTQEVTKKCSDSDNNTANSYNVGGLNRLEIYEKATNKYLMSPVINQDFCVDGTWLNESICGQNNWALTTLYACPYGCQQNACLVGPGNVSQPTCTDSDGGVNYNVKGSLKAANTAVEKIDFCIDTRSIGEYYCENNYNGTWLRYDCPNGCENGACKAAPAPVLTCTDTDGGFNFDVLGTTTDASGNYTDTCVLNANGTYSSNEYYCNGNIAISTGVKCGFGCQNGLCIPGNCTDSDNGNYYVKGTKLSTRSVDTDACYGNYLYEYSCDPPYGNSYQCPNGCQDGACKAAQSNSTIS